MRRILTLGAAALFVTGLACAETYTGKLVDATCAEQQKTAACNPTTTTTTFAIQVSGKTLKLDAEGNKKAAEALQATNNSANRAKEPNAPESEVMATVQGTVHGDEIKVESIQVR